MKTLAAVAFIILAWFYYLGSQPAGVVTATNIAPSERQQWAVDLAARIGNPQPSADTVAFLVAWSQAEDRSDEALSRFNPLNTTQPANGSWTINRDGVQGYPNYEIGMQATIETLLSDHPGYNLIIGGLQTNDVELALSGLRMSPWGTHVGTIEAILQQPQAVVNEGVASAPIGLDGDCGWNVQVALDANGGALRRVEVRPGETFSFNATMGDPAYIDYRNCVGVPGGAWCDLAARYSQVARRIGLEPRFQHHGIQLAGVDWQDSVAIWNIGGAPGFEDGRQDLMITNMTPRTLTFDAQQTEDGQVVIVAGFQQL